MTTASAPPGIATLVDTLAVEVPARTEALLGELWVLADGDGFGPAWSLAWLVGLVLVLVPLATRLCRPA